MSFNPIGLINIHLYLFSKGYQFPLNHKPSNYLKRAEQNILKQARITSYLFRFMENPRY